MEIRRSYDRLIATVGFPILIRRHLYIESGPRCYSDRDKGWGLVRVLDIMSSSSNFKRRASGLCFLFTFDECGDSTASECCKFLLCSFDIINSYYMVWGCLLVFTYYAFIIYFQHTLKARSMKAFVDTSWATFYWHLHIWGRDKMDAVSQTFSSAFSWMKIMHRNKPNITYLLEWKCMNFD